MMLMNNEIRELAFKRSPTNIIRKAAMAGGMKSLLMDAKIKILNGVTTPEEVARVTQSEALTVDQPE
jgi:type II secretory ATPase GspE/PulE/Tfp pilus assembly ATPase PilB-like protein